MTKWPVHIFTIITFLYLTACGPAVKFSSKNHTNISKQKPTRSTAPKEQKTTEETTEEEIVFYDMSPVETVTGIASYYADDFHGKIAYSGEVYDMYGLTAAHPSYPMGTIMVVTNLVNGKSVQIRINDKMPQHPDRIIDLSYGTAKELDMLEDGLVDVMIEVLEWGKGRK